MAVRVQEMKSTAASTEDTTPKFKLTLVERFTPMWGVLASRSIAQEGTSGWRMIGSLLSLVMLGLGGVALFAGGYTSIQGIRIPLWLMGLPVSTSGLPPLAWWSIPAVNTFIQIIGKRVYGLHVLRRPSLWYDGLTTATFMTIWLSNIWLNLGHGQPTAETQGVVILAFIAALFGVLLAVLAEQVFMAGLCMLVAMVTMEVD